MRKISPMKELSTTWEGLKKALLKKVNLLTNGFNKKVVILIQITVMCIEIL